MDDLLQLLAQTDPQLVDALLQYGMTGPEGEILDTRYKQGRREAETPMPGLIQSRGINVSPSPLAYLAATLNKIRGGQDAEAALQQQQANLLRRFPAVHGMLQNRRRQMAAEDYARDAQIAEGEAASAAGTNTAPRMMMEPRKAAPKPKPVATGPLPADPYQTQSPNPNVLNLPILGNLPAQYDPFNRSPVTGGDPWRRRR